MDGQIITWILGLIAAFFGIKWQASVKENQELRQKLGVKKEVLYTDFVKFYLGIINEKKISEQKSIDKMRDFNQQMLLTASNKVYLIYGDLMQNFYHDSRNTMQSLRFLGELILAMREDLGHKDWFNTLYWFDAVRPWIKDIENYTPEKFRGIRGQYSKKVDPMKNK